MTTRRTSPGELQRGWRSWYDRHRRSLQVLSFGAGFVFDVFAAGEGPHRPAMIAQQVAYLLMIGAILYAEVVRDARPDAMRLPAFGERLWRYRDLVVHFCLGTLMNLYSIFFLMSASFTASIVFVAVLFAAVILNEMERVQRRGVDARIGFFVVCVFCFFSLLVPVLLGHVGTLPFVVATAATLAVVGGLVALLRRRLTLGELKRRVVLPAAAVSLCFLGFYAIGLIPPVPIAARTLGVYHRIERRGETFVLSFQRPWWKWWQTSEAPFLAEPGDRVFVFTSIFSPAGFADTAFMRWSYRDAAGAWRDTDRVPIEFTGGHAGGFRAYSWKDRYQPGEWRVTVETTTGLPIARLTFTILAVPVNPNRAFRERDY